MESLGYIKCYSSSSSRPVKSPSNSIRHNKTVLEIRKLTPFFLVINNLVIYKFFKDFTDHRKATDRAVCFSSRPFPNILKCSDNQYLYAVIFIPISLYHYPTSFRHILNSSASIYKSSGSQFFRTSTGIQSVPDAFDESRLVMAFLIIFGVTKMLCNFRLVLEGKTGKEIPKSSKLEFLEKFLTILLYQMQNAEPLGCWIEEVLQIYLCWKHY